MKITFVGDGSTCQLLKVAITVFPDALINGLAECYLDVVNTQGGTFLLLFEDNEYIKDSVNVRTKFFEDAVVCRRFLSNYERVGAGYHKSTVGGDRYTIREHTAQMTHVSPPEDIAGASAIAINLGPTCGTGEAVSTWIHWKQRSGRIRAIVKTRWALHIGTRNIELKNLYLYVVLPNRYRLEEGRVTCAQCKEPFHDRESTQREPLIEILQEAYLEPSFPVYREWQPMFSGHYYLHERRQLELKDFEVAELHCDLASNELNQKQLVLTYVAGILLAVFASLYANSLFALATELHWEGFPSWMYRASICGLVGTALWGWWLLTKAIGRNRDSRLSVIKRVQLWWRQRRSTPQR